MTADEHRVLSDALTSLASVCVDTYVYPHQREYNEGAHDYDVLGRQILCMRCLAELIGRPQDHLLPGEFYEDDTDLPNLFVNTPSKRSAVGAPLNDAERKWLRETILPMLYQVSGVTDSDDAVMRCTRRRIAEVAGHPRLAQYRLLFENDVKPLYFKDYKAEQT